MQANGLTSPYMRQVRVTGTRLAFGEFLKGSVLESSDSVSCDYSLLLDLLVMRDVGLFKLLVKPLFHLVEQNVGLLLLIRARGHSSHLLNLWFYDGIVTISRQNTVHTESCALSDDHFLQRCISLRLNGIILVSEWQVVSKGVHCGSEQLIANFNRLEGNTITSVLGLVASHLEDLFVGDVAARVQFSAPPINLLQNPLFDLVDLLILCLLDFSLQVLAHLVDGLEAVLVDEELEQWLYLEVVL